MKPLIPLLAVFALVATVAGAVAPEQPYHLKQATRSTIVERATRPRPKRQTSPGVDPGFLIQFTATNQAVDGTYAYNGPYANFIAYIWAGGTRTQGLRYNLDASGHLYRVSDGFYAGTTDNANQRVVFQQTVDPTNGIYYVKCQITPVPPSSSGPLTCALDKTPASSNIFFVDGASILSLGSPAVVSANSQYTAVTFTALY